MSSLHPLHPTLDEAYHVNNPGFFPCPHNLDFLLVIPKWPGCDILCPAYGLEHPFSWLFLLKLSQPQHQLHVKHGIDPTGCILLLVWDVNQNDISMTLNQIFDLFPFRLVEGKRCKKQDSDSYTHFTIIWLQDTPGVDVWSEFIWYKGCVEPEECCYEPNDMEYIGNHTEQLLVQDLTEGVFPQPCNESKEYMGGVLICLPSIHPRS